MLDVGDVDVLNTLINKCSVESILLIEKRPEDTCAIEHQHIRGVKSVSGSLCGGLVSYRSDILTNK